VSIGNKGLALPPVAEQEAYARVIPCETILSVAVPKRAVIGHPDAFQLAYTLRPAFVYNAVVDSAAVYNCVL
jgi:hypothetical protein